MINKQSFQQALALLSILSILLACDKPLLEPRVTSGENYIISSNEDQIIKKNEENSYRPSICGYPYEEEDLDVTTIIGLPGLTDTTGPTTLIDRLLGKYNIGRYYTMITRGSENEDIHTHIENTYQTLSEKDLLGSPLLLVTESYGGLVGFGLTQRYKLNVAGMITIHTPWEGVSGAAHILRAYRRLQSLHLGWIVDSSLEYCQLSNYKIPKAMETLAPNSPFLQEVRNTLPNVQYPILALAGNSGERTGPYGDLYHIYRESKYSKVCNFGTDLILGSGSLNNIIQEYEQGNDGLVTTASALAANIDNKPPHFQGKIVDSTHFHGDLGHYPVLLSAADDFTRSCEMAKK